MTTRRLFFALWPGEEERDATLAASRPVREALGGRVVPRANLHLTLCFLGEAAADAEREYRRTADGIRRDPVTIQLDTLEWWEGPRVLCATSAAAMPDALDLARKICPDIRSFRAHVTLAREVGALAPPTAWPMSPVTWRCDRFVLVESRRDALYSVAGEWTLYSA